MCCPNYYFFSMYSPASCIFKFLFLCLFQSSHYVPDLYYNEIIKGKIMECQFN